VTTTTPRPTESLPAGPGASARARLFEPVPKSRVAVLRAAIYLFVVYDLFYVINTVMPLADNSAQLYRPILLRRWLHLPVPDHTWAATLRIVIIVGCLLCASGRLPRRTGALAGVVVAIAFTDWAAISMSYSKINHDHFALVVAVWVLPTIGVARFRDRTLSEAAGWALLCIQVGCVATYFLSALAKVRYGGWDWVTGSTFAWAMTRRGTGLGRMLLDPPWILTASQFLIIGVELLSPLLLVFRRRLRYLMVAGFCLFHLSTWLTLRIDFLALVICLLAFLPLERLLPLERTSP
jgi:hypothetical protein